MPIRSATIRRAAILARYLTGIDFLENPGVPSLVSGIRKTKIPLLPVWEKGVGGDEGQKRKRRKPLLSQQLLRGIHHPACVLAHLHP